MSTEVGRKRRASRTRKEKRTQKAIAILYSNTFVENGSDDPQIFEGTTYDISPSGLSFRTNTPVEHMMTITITCERLWTEPRMGIVKWCSEVYPGVYKVGVSLI